MSTELDEQGLVSASLSDVGRSRSENQDACGEFRSAAGERLLIVADGMGGHRGGATASRICVEAMAQTFLNEDLAPEERMRLGLARANEQVYKAAREDADLDGMGTTAVALLFHPDGRAWVAWVGDSRAYRLRGGRLEALSDDHSVVGEWVRLGVISAEEAEVHPRRHELTRAIGPSESVEVDSKPVEVKPGDRFLLCSDGLCGYLPEPDIAAVLGFEAPDVAVRKLVDRVNEERSGPDNITVQIVLVPGLAETAEVAVIEPPSAPSPEPTRAAALYSSLSLRTVAMALVFAALALAGAGYYALNVGGGGVPVPEERRLGEAAARAQALADVAEAERQRVVEERKRAGAERQVAAQELRDQREAQRVAEWEAMQRERAPAPAPPPAPEAPAEAPPLAEVAAGPRASTAGASGLGSVAAGDPKAVVIERKAPPGELEAAIDEFLAKWTEALNSGDFALYESLGRKQSREEFEQAHARRAGVPVSIELLEYKRWVARFLRVRVRRTSVGQAPQEEYVVLRETKAGLRFAGE